MEGGKGGSLYGIVDHINLLIDPGLTYYEQCCKTNCDLLLNSLCKHNQGNKVPHTGISLPDHFMQQMSFLTDQRLQR